MNIKYVTRNYKPNAHFKEILEKKLSKLDKYFSNDVECKVNTSQQNDFYKLEITINAKGAFFRSEVLSDNMYDNIDIALPKIEKQIVKHSDKFASKFKTDAFNNPELMFLNEKPEKVAAKIVKTKSFELLPTTVEDAIAQMEALGHNFYIFLNVKSGHVNVVYKRNDNDNGLIEVTF